VVAGLEEDTVARLSRNPHVRFAEVDRLVAPAGTANDPYFVQEWHLPKIGAPTAWNTSSGTGVIIAILDSGVDGTHPDLAAQMVPGWNFYNNNNNTADVTGHGTAVAGAAAATTNNALGVASVAGGAKIMPIRISDTSGNALWSSIAQAITWAADHGARVVNFSYSGISANSSTVQTAASYLRSKGGTLYIAAGNTGTNDSTAPSSVITVVSATDQNDNLASFSTYGSFVDIAAPGVSIISTQKGGGYCSCGGTSLATAIVSATAALVLARRPDFGAAQVDSTLKASATDLAPAGTDKYFGAGRVNAAAAVALAGGVAADTTPPTVAIASPTGGSTVAGIVPVSINATDNVGVTKVDLRVNGTTVANDTLAPYQFSWDSTTVTNGSVTLTAVAYDAAGNSAVSAGVALNVSNGTAPPAPPAPTVSITSPPSGSKVSGVVTVATVASDTSGSSGILQSLYIDGKLVATGSGGTMSYKWNTKKAAAGTHTIKATATLSGTSATAQEQVTK
jgi:thermitase